MPIKVIKEKVQKSDLSELELKTKFGAFVKAVIDVEQRIMIAGMTMHADGEETLLENGSQQAHLWGINLYLEEPEENWIEYDSMINLRPAQGNDSRGVDDPVIQEKIRDIINFLIQ